MPSNPKIKKPKRQHISVFELNDMFPDEESAVKWFETVRWGEERHCPHCGCTDTHEVKNRKPMPYRCRGCKSYFSVRTGTLMESSRLPLRKWVFAVYMYVTSLKGISSTRLAHEIKVQQRTAWFMMHRLRDAWDQSGLEAFMGPVEADETYIGGKRKNMSNSKRKELKDAGRGPVGKEAVVGVRDRATNQVRATVVPETDAAHVAGFVASQTEEGAKVYTDEAKVYNALKPLYDHEAVNHSTSEYVRDMAHTNGMESFWANMKRGYIGIFHYMSPKHLQRYVNEFAGKHNVRGKDTIDQMQNVAAAMTGKRLMYRDLIS